MRVVLLVAVMFGVGAPLLAGTPAHAATLAPVAMLAPVATHAPPKPHAPAASAVQASKLSPAVPAGPCQIPGIGDIGGLVGLCQAGSSGLLGDLNNICQPSVPAPEPASGGINAMVQPPATGTAGGKTLYDNYGVAGQYWAAHDMQCSDMTALVGNNIAGMVFDAAKAADRVTITVYQAAAGNNILTWLRNAVDRLITALGNAIYFPYLAPVVILGAIWLAWQGLVRKRATRAIEGTLWMIVAATAAISLIGKPAAFTGVGTTVSNGVTEVLNTAFSKLPNPGGSSCLPVQAGDPQSVTANYSFTDGNGLVDQNADELWSVLVCKPWLYGELGTTQYAQTGTGSQTIVNTFGRQLLWAQAFAVNENPTAALTSAKQSTYTGIAQQLKQTDPAAYSLFQGKQWTTRLEIAFAAIFAALVAGLLILLIALTLIVLKLGFLLLLVAGPFFLIIGTHPGFGRIIAIRWFEMLVGVLMKQVAIAIVLSVLLYCYSLIMGTSDDTLPWALKILMIALVTVTVFIYRRPFQHLFSAVGYGASGSQERAEISLRQAGVTARGAAGAAPLSRAVRWARRNPAGAAAAAATGGAGAAVAAAGALSEGQEAHAAPPVTVPEEASMAGAVSSGATGRARALGENGTVTAARPAPPLDLPTRSAPAADTGSWSRGAGRPPASRTPPALPPSGGRSGPAWPASGWSGARGARPRQDSKPAPPPDGASKQDRPAAQRPFWLRKRGQ